MPKTNVAFLKLVGQRIRTIRLDRGMSQEELALRVGKTQNIISRYESGQQAMRIGELPLLAQALAVPISAFFDAAALPERLSVVYEQLSVEGKETVLRRADAQLKFERQVS